MKVFVLLIKYIIKKIFRKAYWLFRLTKISFGKKPNLSFPIKVEGKGRASLGDFAIIQKDVNIGIGTNAHLKIGHRCNLESDTTILLKENIRFTIGNDFKLGRSSRLYVKNNWDIGDDVKIETNCSIFGREPEDKGILTIKNGTRIGDYTIMDVVDDITIGKDVAIGPNCTLYTHDHVYTDKNLPAWKGGLVSKPIIIEDGAWVGSGVTLLPGVTIGKRAVIAAGSVVTKSVEAESIYGGVPAKFIKTI
jgi:acetyltransferase-like isoleucine patch superfamily enzyme